MSSAENKAVFLSYASQDAEAAKRLADALRAAGVEVWFDAEGGLEHGDEWDAKIRRQIKECVLFLPVISANTQAREEGYFRIEWDLAAERARGIASGVAFILPVVIDGTKDAEALVPDRFRSVQWTKLPDGTVPPDVLQRFLKLWSHRTGALKQSAMEAGRPRPAEERGEGTPPPRKNLLLIVAALGLLLLAAVAYLIFKPRRSPEEIAKIVADAQAMGNAAAAKPASVASDADPFVARAYAQIGRMNYTRDNLAAAEDLTRRATEAASDSARAWGARAYVNACYIQRGWDISEKRRQVTQEFANRALALDANEGEALVALCSLFNAQRAFAQAEATARRGLALRPDDSRLHRALGTAANGLGRTEEAFAIRQENVKLFPREPLTFYDLALAQRSAGDFEGALQNLEAALALEPFPSALLMKTMLLAAWKGDLAGARATLDQVAPIDRTEDRAVGMAMWLGLLERQPARVIEAGAQTARPYFEDTIVRGARAFSLALAYQLDGKTALARAQWEAAEGVLRARVQDPAAIPTDRALWATALAALGRTEEAAREFAPYEAVISELPESRALPLAGYYFCAQYYALLGDAARAGPYLRREVIKGGTFVSDHTLLIDPRWDRLHGTPEFEALLAESKARLAAKTAPMVSAKADDKSVAVLAFANLSDDKANEYFSDGISEELLNVLAKVPGLTVRGRSSGFYFKGRQVKSAEIGQQLNVSYLVQGSVRRAGDRVRISAQLIRAATDEVVWSSGSLDRDLKDIFAVQDEIAGLIAKNLSLKIGVAARASHQVNPEALTALLEGRSFWVLRTTEGFTRAGELFNRAVALDPDWATAHAALASLLTIEASYRKGGGDSVSEQFALAAREAKRAIELDPTLGEPHAALGKIAMEDRRFAEAEEESSRALVLEPNNALVVDWHGDLMVTRGRLDTAIAAYRRAMELEPLSPYILWDLAWELTHVRRYGEALALIERAATLTPTGSARLSLRRARLLLELGRKAEAEIALRVYLESPRTGSDPQIANEAVWCLQTIGTPADRERWTAELLRQYPDSFASGVILLMLGREEKAYPLLEKFPTIFWQQLYWEPFFDAVRDTPRFQRLLEKLGCAAEYKVARETQARLLKENRK